jgi:hypothetical protein
MPITPPAINESDPRRVNHTIRQITEGRSNAHGTFTLAVSPATSTTVTATTCGAGSHVSITPTNANAAALAAVSVVAGNGQFVVTHTASALSCTFSFGIIG